MINTKIRNRMNSYQLKTKFQIWVFKEMIPISHIDEAKNVETKEYTRGLGVNLEVEWLA